jgi:hypothetical protein
MAAGPARDNKSGRKSGNATSFRRGADSRRGKGPQKGAPLVGRPPDEFKERMAGLASWSEVHTALESILRDPEHPHWMRALEYATERGYGKVTQPVGGDPDAPAIRFTLAIGAERA